MIGRWMRQPREHRSSAAACRTERAWVPTAGKTIPVRVEPPAITIRTAHFEKRDLRAIWRGIVGTVPFCTRRRGAAPIINRLANRVGSGERKFYDIGTGRAGSFWQGLGRDRLELGALPLKPFGVAFDGFPACHCFKVLFVGNGRIVRRCRRFIERRRGDPDDIKRYVVRRSCGRRLRCLGRWSCLSHLSLLGRLSLLGHWRGRIGKLRRCRHFIRDGKPWWNWPCGPRKLRLTRRARALLRVQKSFETIAKHWFAAKLTFFHAF